MMKKRTTLVALVLAAILLCAALASCDMAEDVKDGFDESMKDEMFKNLKLEDTFEDGKPYHLYFMSNGDGTCAVKYMTTDPDNTQDFVVEIPETSPAGDKVTQVDLQLTTAERAWDPDEPTTQQLPLVLRAADLDAICAQMKGKGIKDFDLNKFKAYYLKIALTDMDDMAKLEAEDAFPIAALGDIYVFDMNASVAEQQKILSYLTTYCDWDEDALVQYYLNVLELVKLSESLEQAEACLSLVRYMGTEHVVGISIPKTVTNVGSDAWRYLKALQSVEVAAENTVIKMIDGCLVDTVTGTLLRCFGDGRIPDGADIQTIGSYAFAGCELTIGEGGVKEGIHLYIPEGVTTLKKDCFDGMIVEDMSVFTIHLPTTLTTFEAPDSFDEIYVYTYAGTRQEWDERVTFTGAGKKDCYIYLITSDQPRLNQFFIPKAD